MSEIKIYKGRGSAEMRDDYIDFINYVFSFNENRDDFPKLLPTLYKPEYHPCENNYVVTETASSKPRSAYLCANSTSWAQSCRRTESATSPYTPIRALRAI